tara:strand:- start:95552 stop:96736 length:1185 start_codon:yes stop_codon:yes gene_type:complete
MSKILVLAVVVLVIIAIAQLSKMYELSRKVAKKREEDISLASNKLNAKLMLVYMVAFYAFFIYLTVAYGEHMLPVAASEHGAKVDTLMDLNLVFVSAVFFLMNTLLFVFASKYYKREGQKAKFQPHDNRLELIWTVIPSIVLFAIIISGLVVWNDITDAPKEDAIVIEIYSKQFDWTARYGGDNNQLGNASVNFISATNPLGVISSEVLVDKKAEMNAEIEAIESDLENKVFSDANEAALKTKLSNLKAQRARVAGFKYSDEELALGYDDKLVKAEFHIPVGRQVHFQFRSQDVIHSAYMPHFRAQMNTVPGMTTVFNITPTITTDSMRTITGNKDFNYVLMCNKICGSAHYNMKMDIIVESEEDYNKWLADQKTFAKAYGLEEKAKDLAVNNK